MSLTYTKEGKVLQFLLNNQNSDDIWKFIKAKNEHDNPDAKSDLYKELELKE